VFTLVQPEQKRMAFVRTDSKLQLSHSLPEASQFIRWLSDDTILLKKPTGMVQFEIGKDTALPLFEPPGWKVNTIVPGTSLQLLTGEGGRFAVKDGPGDLQEVLAGVKIERDFAAADDLTLFGGVDAQKRLWVQHGISSKPEVAAEHVERVVWGPISRRVVVQGANGNLRIYDGRNRSWIPLPPMLLGQWSPDEERLLYLEAERRDNTLVPQQLSLLDGRTPMRLFDITRIGEIRAMAFGKRAEIAFLLAGPNDAPGAWMLTLPHASPAAPK